MANFHVVAGGLGFAEGPVWCSNGDTLVVDIKSGKLIRVDPDGTTATFAECGGGPNGMAVGPDAMLYVCNNGGFEWNGPVPSRMASDYSGGSIQRVDPHSGEWTTLYTSCDGRSLRGPNDIVFDRSGGFWFTDLGKSTARARDHAALYYAQPDGSSIVEMAFPLDGANGCGLSPDQTRLYVAETFTGRVFFWNLDGPGRIRRNPHSPHGGHYLGTVANGLALDSMAIDAEGNLCIGAPGYGGGIVVFSPDGSQRLIPTDDPLPTNICFGQADLRTAYMTWSLSGQLVRCPWDVPGAPLAFNL